MGHELHISKQIWFQVTTVICFCMDDIEDDARYPPNHYSDNHSQVYDYQELDMRGSSYSQPVPNEYLQDNNDVDEEDEEQNSLTDWTEHETFVLLDAWGDRFLQRERKSLRSDEWHEVADEVSKVSKIDRTDTQCRNRIDTLKKKYKKEIMKFPAMGVGSSKWLYFERMNKLMSPPPQQTSLSCEMQSQKHSVINSRVNLNHPNGVDKTRNSPETTESTSEDGSIGARGKKRKKRRCNDGACSFRLLADSIHKFSKIYEKIENSKRQQMVELERMRMDLHKELETQKRQILKRMQSKIWKLEQGDDENDDDSAENEESTTSENFDNSQPITCLTHENQNTTHENQNTRLFGEITHKSPKHVWSPIDQTNHPQYQ
ncbi:hypothetical protein Ahy_A07g037360 [Arachis hypogaea]|uniref:Myb-like domain-containing protein n=1 Tax=Arachis hypogaea TaxID=3818 RepID=A0A445CIJ7_ARAHY|nr:hypothetical protein Ahy_A07g037360 [Arachis hypogaea]